MRQLFHRIFAVFILGCCTPGCGAEEIVRSGMFDTGGSGGEAGTNAAGSSGSGESGSAGAGGDGGSAGTASSVGGSAGSGGASGGDGGSAGSGGAGGSSGSAGGGAGGSGGELSFDEFCDRAQTAACDWLERCGGADTACEEWWGFQRIAKTCAFAPAAVSAGRIAYHGHAALTCVDRAQTDACDAELSLLTPEGSCSEVLEGLQGLSDDCYIDSNHITDECAAGYCISNEACPSSCTPFLEVSQTCDRNADKRCNPETTFCNDQLQCELLKTPGEPCAAGQCEAGLVCVSIPQSAICAKPIALGEACELALQCTGNAVCKDGVCVGDVAAGDVCVSDANCPKGYGCYVAEDAYQPTCRKLPTAGQSCDEGVCGPNLFCNMDTCQPYGRAGDDCSVTPCALGFWCKIVGDAHTCEADGAANDDCADDLAYPFERRCQDGLYCTPTAVDAERVPTGYACLSPRDAGAACNLGESLSCKSGLRCARETSTCLPPAAEGETCHPLWPLLSCEAGLYCECRQADCPILTHNPNTDDVCVKRQANDAACEADYECLSNHCADALCADPEDPLTSGCTQASLPSP